ncbi:MAG TPA: bifunctional hydroxymethylpyrimidine kinase/phosphomethylpyrimidine kinase [Pyrinomonadaceae bacterium]|jgi:hydroxymethylpyrimidine kinase/phosphomethylpyrimidine kinase|nr:bifunctional hydroxymethylpyrimidine kinase/phosphomethylpyrimidine kinase [Pyrinomonadaceae bacterium]
MTLHQETSTPVALTIAGLDPSGGAGIIADIKTFTAFGCFANAVVTSLTFQNTTGVYGAEHQSADAVRAQVLPLVQDFRIACVKTGMLPTREMIFEVARLFREMELPAPVVDPVVRSTSGYDLIDDDALASLREELLPLARVLTPNIPEAERLTGLRVSDEEGMRRAAQRLREMGARAVLIKGGHLASQGADKREAEANSNSTSSVPDLLDEDGRITIFRGERIKTNSTHGTGCTLSAAIAACLGRGLSLQDSIGHAKRFVTEALRHAPGLGHGFGPINPGTVTSDE